MDAQLNVYATLVRDDGEADVRQSLAWIKADSFIVRKDRIRAFVLDVATGKLDEGH
ncbi:hypothetical protein [Streptomyces sp. NPDC002088]|uniref:hypothetical protein n=1 Tax=Streptomyces sp. NPDC002088 TaxID=3154665 RepID=UPI00331B5075